MALTRSKSAVLFAPSDRVRQTRGGTTCCVPGCFNNTVEDNKSIQFYSFPTQLKRRILWLERIGRPQWVPSSQHVVCGNHFVGRNMTSASGAVQSPTVFPRFRSTRGPSRGSSSPVTASRGRGRGRGRGGAGSQRGHGTAMHHHRKSRLPTTVQASQPAESDLEKYTSLAYNIVAGFALRTSSLKSSMSALEAAARICDVDHSYSQPRRAKELPDAQEIMIDGVPRTCYKLAVLPEWQARLFSTKLYHRQGISGQPSNLVNGGALHMQLPSHICHYLPTTAFLSRLKPQTDKRVHLVSSDGNSAAVVSSSDGCNNMSAVDSNLTSDSPAAGGGDTLQVRPRLEGALISPPGVECDVSINSKLTPENASPPQLPSVGHTSQADKPQEIITGTGPVTVASSTGAMSKSPTGDFPSAGRLGTAVLSTLSKSNGVDSSTKIEQPEIISPIASSYSRVAAGASLTSPSRQETADEDSSQSPASPDTRQSLSTSTQNPDHASNLFATSANIAAPARGLVLSIVEEEEEEGIFPMSSQRGAASPSSPGGCEDLKAESNTGLDLSDFIYRVFGSSNN